MIHEEIRYLNITRLNLGLLINSKNARLEWKRVLRPQEPHPQYFRGSNPQLHTSPGIFSSIWYIAERKGLFPGIH